MEYIHASRRERRQKLFKLGRCLRQFRSKVLLLPLRKSQDDREILPHLMTNALHDLRGEPRALHQRTAIFVRALISAFPEKVVNEVTMGTVQFHCIKAQTLGIHRRLGKSGDNFIYLRGG